MNNIRSCCSCLTLFHKARQHNVEFTLGSVIFYKSRRLMHYGINEAVQNRLRNQDSMGKDNRIIYRAPLLNYVKIAYGVTTISSSILIPVVSANVLMEGVGNYPITLWNAEVLHSSFELTAFYGFSLLSITQIVYTIFKYPFRIYYNESSGKYTAIYQHILPWKTEKEEFYAGDIKKINKSFSIWNNILYSVNNRKALLLEDHFYIPEDMNNMLFPKNKDQ